MGAMRDKASDIVSDFISSEDDQAIAAYHSLSSSHSSSSGLVNAAGMETGAPEVINPEFGGPGGSTARPAAGPGAGTCQTIGGGAGRPALGADEWTQDPAGFGTGLAGAGGGGPMSVGAPSSVPGGLGGLFRVARAVSPAAVWAEAAVACRAPCRPVQPCGAVRAARVACR